MTRAVLYARVSGDDSKYATSGVKSQLNDCRKYAREKGYKVVGEFNEDADKRTSGADWLPELVRILGLAEQSFFDVLIVREIDRLARNKLKQMLVENQLEILGVRVEYVNGRYEDTAEGRLVKGVMGELAEFELAKIRERTRRGMISSIKAGNVSVGGSFAPLGYCIEKKGKSRQLIINELEAAIVRLIFELYGKKGYTLWAIVDYLNEHKIPKPGKGENHKSNTSKKHQIGWSPNSVSNILKNETYVGRWYYRKTERVKNPKTGTYRNIPRPKSEWLLIEVPAIIDEELFELVQRRRDENKQLKGKQHKHFYMLGGMLECGRCGNSMLGKTKVYKNQRYTYYQCNTINVPKRYGFKCDNISFNPNEVDAAVWAWIKSILLSPEKLNESLELHQDKQRAGLQPLISMIEANEAKLASVKEQKERLIKAYTDGVLSLDEMADRKVAIDKEIEDLTKAIANFRAELNPKLLSPQEIASIKEWTEKINLGADVVTKNSPEKVRGILQQLQVRVILGFDGKDKWAKVTSVLGEKALASELQYSNIYCKPLTIEQRLIISPVAYTNPAQRQSAV